MWDDTTMFCSDDITVQFVFFLFGHCGCTEDRAYILPLVNYYI